MRQPHLFEFMDQDWVPASLRATLREILECGNSRPFRPYYQWVAGEVEQAAREGGFETIVELGAGTAPITRLLAGRAGPDHFRLVPCDMNPDQASYRLLEQGHPGTVAPIYSPVDFSKPRQWGPDTLLLLSATFHHVPPADRPGVLETLAKSARRVMIFEPLRKTPSSVLFVFLSLVPAVVLPAWFLGRPGTPRRILWCWLVPVAPLMFWWDGVVSCLRQWREREWREAGRNLGKEIHLLLNKSFFCYFVSI